MSVLPSGLAARVDAVRRFNRLYTPRIGVLQQGYLDSALTLSQVRVLYEVRRVPPPSASDLARDLGLDAAYLSRLLRSLERAALVRKEASRADGRKSLLLLTPRGRRMLTEFERRSRRKVEALLRPLSLGDQERLVAAMRAIEELLADRSSAKTPYLLRPFRPGDLGWVIAQHGLVYANEYGWDITFEAHVAGIVKDIVEHFDPKRERCWIAERDGQVVGSVFLVRKSDTVAKLRLLIVDRAARGLGIGARLVDECTQFARQAGYKTITLWTNNILDAARHIYQDAGYRLVHRAKPERMFGKMLVFETWELEL